LPKGYEGLQLDVAEEKGIPILRWHDPALNVASARDQALLARAEVMVTAFEEFKSEIVTRVRKRQAEQKLSAIEGNGAFVLVNANSRDGQVTQTLLQTLDQQGMGYDTADENDNVEMLVEQYDFHGLIVVYGQCEQQWAKQQVRACRQLLLKKKQRAPVCAVYLGPLDEKPSLGISIPNVHYVSHHNSSAISNFLRAVQKVVAPHLTVVPTPPRYETFERMRGTPALLGGCPAWRWHRKRPQFLDGPAMLGDARGHCRYGPAPGVARLVWGVQT